MMPTPDHARANCARAELRYLLELLQVAQSPTLFINRVKYETQRALLAFDKGDLLPDAAFKFVTSCYDRLIRSGDGWQVGFVSKPF